MSHVPNTVETAPLLEPCSSAQGPIATVVPPSSSHPAKGWSRRIPNAVFWALLGQAIFSVTRLLSSMTVGGRFGYGSEEQLGYYSSAFGVLMVVVGLHEAFVTTPFTIFNQQVGPEQRRTHSAQALVVSSLVIGVVLVMAAVLAIGQSLFHVLDPSLAAVMLAVLGLAPLQLLREFSRRWLLAHLNVRSSALMEFVYGAVFLVAMGGLLVTGNVTALTVFAAIGAVNLVGLGIWWSTYGNGFRFDKKHAFAQASRYYRYGRWVAGENLCSTLTMYSCVWILMSVLGEAAAGVFFACFTIIMLANPFLLGVAGILSPRAAQEYVRGGWPGLRRVLTTYGIFIFSVLSVFALAMCFFGSQLTELFFSSTYAEYFDAHYGGQNRVTGILALAMPVLGLSFVLTTGLLAIGRPNDSFMAAAVGLVILLVVNLMVVEPSLETAALSFVASIGGGMLCRALFLVRAYRRDTVQVRS